MICPHCNEEARPGVAYCGSCGKPFLIPEIAVPHDSPGAKRWSLKWHIDSNGRLSRLEYFYLATVAYLVWTGRKYAYNAWGSSPLTFSFLIVYYWITVTANMRRLRDLGLFPALAWVIWFTHIASQNRKHLSEPLYKFNMAVGVVSLLALLLMPGRKNQLQKDGI